MSDDDHGFNDEELEGLKEMEREKRDFTARIYNGLIKRYARTDSPITFYEKVEIDAFSGYVTMGEWGGYFIEIASMLYNDRIILTPVGRPMTYSFTAWCMLKGAAPLAVLAWNPETEAEPQGFIKRVGPARVAGETAPSREEVAAEEARYLDLWALFGIDLRSDDRASQ